MVFVNVEFEMQVVDMIGIPPYERELANYCGLAYRADI